MMESTEEFIRYCGHCGQPIPGKRLLKAIASKARVFFCCDQCRFADANAKTRAAKKLRQENPNRRACSHCAGRGYTRVNRPQRGRNGETPAQAEQQLLNDFEEGRC
jgi:hypothetical protein